MVKNLEKNGVYAVAVKTFFYMFPGIIAMIICCIPVLYFGGLYSQEDYCKQVIKVNKWITKDSITLQERCSAFNLDELFEYVQNKNNT